MVNNGPGLPHQHRPQRDEVIDVATRKAINHFTLNTPTRQYRIFARTPDPDGLLFYAVTKEITQFPEHFEVAKPKYTVIDLAQQKISTGVHGTRRCEFRAFDLSNDHITQKAELPCRTRFSLGMSGDGKKLYIYGPGFDIEVCVAATLK